MKKKFILLMICAAGSFIQASQTSNIPLTKTETKEEVSYILSSEKERLTATHKKGTNNYNVSLRTNNPGTPPLSSPWVKLIVKPAHFEKIFNELARMYQEKRSKK